MSRAFTREDDDRDAVVPQPASPLPAGARNYLTATGARCLRQELARLVDAERPRLITASSAVGGMGADAKQELPVVEHRIAYLQQSLATAQVSPPPPLPHEVVHFGATVTVRDPRGAETTYRIVGVDETNPDRNEVSWLSPVARALLNARRGDQVPFKFPAGLTQLEITAIRYEE
jgi:transcription elongation factor GreB